VTQATVEREHRSLVSEFMGELNLQSTKIPRTISVLPEISCLISRQKTSASQIKGQLEASRVELPGQFSEIPETNQLAWANQVYGYFAAKMYSVEDTPVSGKGSKD
jgi:hypothetical protein